MEERKQASSVEYAQAALRAAYQEGFDAGVDSVQGDYVLIPRAAFSEWLGRFVGVIKELPLLVEEDAAEPPPPPPPQPAPVTRPARRAGRRPAAQRQGAAPPPTAYPPIAPSIPMAQEAAPYQYEPDGIRVQTRPVMLTPDEEGALTQAIEKMAVKSSSPVNW